MSEDVQRPGDAARRALRAARARETEPGPEKANPGEPDPTATAAKPGVPGVRDVADVPDEPGVPDEPDVRDEPEVPATAVPDMAGMGTAAPATSVPDMAGTGGAVPATPGTETAGTGRAVPAAAGSGTAALVTDVPVTRVPRPGDAARRALRTAAVAKDAGTRETGPDAEADAGARPGASAAVRPAGRPGDIAREALRAARAEARRAGEAAAQAAEGTPAGASRRQPAPPPATATSRTRTARDLKQFLATAFRMPSTEPEPTPEDKGKGEHGQAPRQDRDDAPTPTKATSDTAPTPAVATSGTPEPDPAPTPPPAPTPTSSEPAVGPEPGTPHLPHTMATPHRDSELRRTFPSLPSRVSAAAPEFAETWWGNAWVRALEEGALDVKRLARGRSYAEQGHVDAITVTPGTALAYVQGSRPRPYRVQVRLRTFGEEEWERFLEAAADRPADIAALLDKELPQALADSGVPLLPGPGELEPRCSCPDFGHPCKHAAALCYQTARLLDADPFVLLLLRGRGERDLLDALSRRNAARGARERRPVSLPGVRAAEALVARRLPPLPAPLPVPVHPEQPPVYPGVPGGPDPFALDQLATDAAARAHALLTTGHDPVGELTLWQDAVRLAAARPGSGLTVSTRALYASLAAAVGRTPGDLSRAVAAWRQGGPAGLAVLEDPWDPPAGRFDRARPLLLAADLPAFRPWRNHLTHPGGHVQLRLGQDGLWYAYESEPGHDDWWPRGTPDLDPVGALTGLGASGDL